MNLSKELYRINYLVSYPLSDKMIVDWAVCINTLEPFITPEILHEIIDSMIMGCNEYNPNKGIQNIFNSFKNWLSNNKKNIPTEVYEKHFNKAGKVDFKIPGKWNAQ